MFSKTKSVIKEAVKPTATIEQVHNEFDTATERILEQANKILANQTEQDVSELQSLSNLGFRQPTEQYRAYKQSKEQSEYAKYYEKYDYKFITETELKRICRKYGLVIGLPEDFIGDIPAENRKDIINMKVAEEDKSYLMSFGRDSWSVINDKSDHSSSSYRISYKENFKIVGTLDQFDMTYKVIEDNVVRLIDKDPIVLQGVKGGYLIITKWGINIEELK